MVTGRSSSEPTSRPVGTVATTYSLAACSRRGCRGLRASPPGSASAPSPAGSPCSSPGARNRCGASAAFSPAARARMVLRSSCASESLMKARLIAAEPESATSKRSSASPKMRATSGWAMSIDCTLSMRAWRCWRKTMPEFTFTCRSVIWYLVNHQEPRKPSRIRTRMPEPMRIGTSRDPPSTNSSPG